MDEQVRGILDGGPFHGRIMHVAARDRIAIPYAPPISPVIVLPPRRRWHRLLRRPVPIPPDPPQFRNLIYRKTAERRYGNIVYRYEPDSTAVIQKRP
jgi:hypothetical protein